MFTVISVVLGGGFFYMFGALEKIRLLEVRRLYHLDLLGSYSYWIQTD
jgi:hypothetical protein